MSISLFTMKYFVFTQIVFRETHDSTETFRNVDVWPTC